MTRPRRMLITAGPTHEAIDPVRFLGNRSSGKLGVALAAAAHAAGWQVTLLLGPTKVDAPPPDRWRTERFVSTDDLAALLDVHLPQCDVLVMTAAVADYRPRHRSATKLPRTDAGMSIELEPTPDLVARCVDRKRADQVIVAFALEDPADLEARARRKMHRKGVDAIVANPLSTMDADTIDAHVLIADPRKLSPRKAADNPEIPRIPRPIPPEGSAESAGGDLHPGPMPKVEFAAWLVDWLDHFTPEPNA